LRRVVPLSRYQRWLWQRNLHQGQISLREGERTSPVKTSCWRHARDTV